MSDRDTKKMMNEINILGKVNSHFIVGYFESYTQGTKINIVMEYC